ncbi:TPA: hypothetical protein HA361_06320 [Candidatus Woesearchaeota archaeon]|nr:hypothetical protein [Candidatus Woesearchaeota archaeon]HII68985.1 hypothetical protein [Candidatus Woesearchaeota archaeon]
MLTFIHGFSILFIIIALIALLIKVVKQPIIIAYVIAGFLFSFFITGNTGTGEQILIMAELGITFLLFLMGIEFNFHQLKYMGRDIIIATTLQSVIFFMVAMLPPLLLGFGTLESIYFAVLFMFSSTLLVAKWVEDKKETSTLHGKIILGTLVVQDVIAIIILTTMNLMSETSLGQILLVPVKGIALAIAALIFARYLLNAVLKIALKYPELLFVFSLGICFFFVEVAIFFGYSAAIGAFIAGVTLANTDYRQDIYSRLKPLILFFNVLFFVGLGFQVSLNLGRDTLLLLAAYLFLCMVLKPVVFYLTFKMRGYDLKTSCKAAISLAQFSEFGIIIITSGIAGGAIGGGVGSVAVIMVIVTMVISSYTIKNDALLFRRVQPVLRLVDRYFPVKLADAGEVRNSYEIIFFGYYEVSLEIREKIASGGKKMLVIEQDPSVIHSLKKANMPFLYSSLSSPYFFEHLDLSKTEIVVSSLIDMEDNRLLIKEIKKRNPSCILIVTAKGVHQSLELYELGADYVIYPSYLNEQKVSILLEDYTNDINEILVKKIEDITNLRKKTAVKDDPSAVFDMDEFLRRITQKVPFRKKQNQQENGQ